MYLEAVLEVEEEELEIELEASENWNDKHITFFGPDTRTILVGSEIDAPLSNAVVSQIFELISQDPEKPIRVFINTGGGAIKDALSIYDALRAAPCPIITIVTGEASSAGLVICSAGDLRLCFEHSQFFHHSVISVSQSVTQVDSDELHAHYQWCQNKTHEIIRKAMRMSIRKWEREFGDRTSKFFYGPEAQELGLIHKILPSSRSKKVPESYLG